MSNPEWMLGWDVGGAHLKAALLDSKGKALHALQVPCALWRGLHVLQDAIDLAKSQLALHGYPAADIQQHVVTMTGELADVFSDRHTGVMQIASLMHAQLAGHVRFYAGKAGFVELAEVARHSALIASANWLASANFVAQQVAHGLLVDIGSTTSDFVLLADGTAQVRGNSDAERMQYDELVYTGVVRTPLMALAQRLPVAGAWVSLAAEHFCTMADIYRLTGELDATTDMADTADGASKSLEDSARRLARMVGHDSADAGLDAWIQLARACKQLQLTQLKHAALLNLSRQIIPQHACLIGAGAGAFLVEALAKQLHRPHLDIAEFIKSDSTEIAQWAATCLPAYSVAWLALQAMLPILDKGITISQVAA